jgi:uncharacterized protein
VIRVVIDPGVFISALIASRGGAPDLVVRAFVDDRIKVVASPLLLAELELVLRRPKFAAYFDERTAREFVERIRRHAMIVDDPIDQPAVTRDRKDDYLVALARSEHVDAIVSGDPRPDRCRARSSSGVDSTAAHGSAAGELNGHRPSSAGQGTQPRAARTRRSRALAGHRAPRIIARDDGARASRHGRYSSRAESPHQQHCGRRAGPVLLVRDSVVQGERSKRARALTNTGVVC